MAKNRELQLALEERNKEIRLLRKRLKDYEKSYGKNTDIATALSDTREKLKQQKQINECINKKLKFLEKKIYFKNKDIESFKEIINNDEKEIAELCSEKILLKLVK